MSFRSSLLHSSFCPLLCALTLCLYSLALVLFFHCLARLITQRNHASNCRKAWRENSLKLLASLFAFALNNALYSSLVTASCGSVLIYFVSALPISSSSSLSRLCTLV